MAVCLWSTQRNQFDWIERSHCTIFRTRPRAHCGATNDRLVLHLGVDVKDGPADHSDHSGLEMVVGGEVGSWAAGRVTAFDDSFEHEVYHRGQHRRVVLLLHIDHPSLTAYRAQQHQQKTAAAAGDVEEILLHDDEEEDDDATAGLGLVGWLRTVRPALPDAALLGYAAVLSQSQPCRETGESKQGAADRRRRQDWTCTSNFTHCKSGWFAVIVEKKYRRGCLSIDSALASAKVIFTTLQMRFRWYANERYTHSDLRHNYGVIPPRDFATPSLS